MNMGLDSGVVTITKSSLNRREQATVISLKISYGLTEDFVFNQMRGHDLACVYILS